MDKNKGIEGSGLGLAIVSGFVKLMNGKIRVESEYGKGSEFIITVPQKRVGQERINKIEWNMGEILEEKERVQFCAEEAKILVVDDNELNLEITKGLLGIYGISTQVSLSGKEAIKLAEKEKYDIIFMDCMMPEMDGITAMKHIKAQMKGRDESTPIIALTANAIVGVREEMIGEGFQDYMSKPINMSDLERILLEYLPKEKVKLGQKKSISEKPVIVWEKPEEEKTKGSEDEIEKIKEYINEYQFEEAVQMLEELSQSYGNLYSREEVSWFKEQVLNYQSEELLSWLEEKKKSI